jgi:hypothetical protein
VEWSHWFRCESSFDLPLVPQTAGLFAVSRKGKGRELTIMHVETADNLFQGLSALFSDGSPLRDEIAKGNCFVRFAQVPDRVFRQGACAILQDWVAGHVPPHVIPGLIEDFLATDSSVSR